MRAQFLEQGRRRDDRRDALVADEPDFVSRAREVRRKVRVGEAAEVDDLLVKKERNRLTRPIAPE
ncbi:MAG: hypothetical protein WDN30_16170 [Pararobbsia sp.]